MGDGLKTKMSERAEKIRQKIEEARYSTERAFHYSEIANRHKEAIKVASKNLDDALVRVSFWNERSAEMTAEAQKVLLSELVEGDDV